MTRKFPYCLCLIGSLALTACGQKDVSFKTDVMPVLQQYCLECHTEKGEGAQKSGLVMESYDGLMKGTRFGAIVKPGDSLTSALNMLVEGRAAPTIRMPHHKNALPKEKTELLKQWVDQGAKNN